MICVKQGTGLNTENIWVQVWIPVRVHCGGFQQFGGQRTPCNTVRTFFNYFSKRLKYKHKKTLALSLCPLMNYDINIFSPTP